MVHLVNVIVESLPRGGLLQVLILVLFFLGGCVTKNKADAQARAAFLAGQRQTLEIVQQAQSRGPSVTVVGEVSNPVIPWTEDLTLAKAIVAADFRGRTDPVEILLARGGKATSYDPKKLLNGEDIPLQPNDVVQIKR